MFCLPSKILQFIHVFRSLNNLPKEHILMLNTVVVFIREVSKEKSSENILQSLLRYYCDAVFIRPFTPGHRVAVS